MIMMISKLEQTCGYIWMYILHISDIIEYIVILYE